MSHPASIAGVMVLLLALGTGCSTNEQERAGTGTGSKSQIASGENERTDQPVQVSGSFLWQCDFAEDVAATAAEVTIGCNLMHQTTRVDISNLDATAVLVDGSGVTKDQMQRGSESAQWHFTVKIAQTSLKGFKTRLDVKDSAGKSSSFTAPLASLAGELMINITASRTFDLAGGQFGTVKDRVLEAVAFCSSSGPRSSVEMTPAPLVPVLLGSSETAEFSDPADAPCFKPIKSLIDGSLGKFFKASEMVSPYLAAGPQDGGAAVCWFAVLSGGATAGGDRMVIVAAADINGTKSIQRTAFTHRCK